MAGERPVLTALTLGWEARVVESLERARGELVVVRRCADLTDLLASAKSGRASAALVSADLPRLSADAIDRLRRDGIAVVGVTEPGEDHQRQTMHDLGVPHVVSADSPADIVASVVKDAVAQPVPPRSLAAPSDPDDAIPLLGAGEADPAQTARTAAIEPSTGRGRVVAVWGPPGSPGRTTVALTLAAELAALGEDTLLADADTYGACVAQALGVLDEAPGLAAACRSAAAGALDPAMLARLSPLVAPRLRVLTGITRSDRWPELSASGLARVWEVSRSCLAWTVIDTGFGLERDEELIYDTAAPRRNASTLAALEAADDVIVVGSADPVGLQRLVRGLGELGELGGLSDSVAPRVVVTRVRVSALGRDPQRRIGDVLGRYAGVREVVCVPDDRPAFDAAMLAGRTLTEHAPRSPARRALAELAAALAGRGELRPARRRRRARVG